MNKLAIAAWSKQQVERTERKQWVLERRIEEQRGRVGVCERALRTEQEKLAAMIAERERGSK